MKNLFLSIFLSFSASLAWSQVEFAPLGAEWYYRYTPGYTSSPARGFAYAQSIGDTLLAGRVCKKICTNSFTVPTSLTNCGDNSVINYIYQSADSIFRYHPYAPTYFELLFRNNFQLGESFTTVLGKKWVVGEVEALNLNNSPVRRFRLNDMITGDSIYIYDIFGPETGIFERFPGEIADVSTLQLRCYADATVLQVNIAGEPCNAILGATEPRFSLNIFPNPTNEVIELEFVGALAESPNIKLYDALGRKVLEERFDQGQKRLNLRNMASGFYLLTAEADGAVVQQKVVKY